MLMGPMVGEKAGAGRTEDGKSGRSGDDAPRGSLRERRDREAKKRRGEDDEKEKKPKKNLKTQVATTVPLVLVVVLAGFVGFSHGGPDSSGVAVRPELTSWTLTASYPDGSDEELCSSGRDCGLDDLRPAVEAGADCWFKGTVWLETRTNPVLLRDVTVENVNATSISLDPDYNGTQDLNYTMEFADNPMERNEGLWWRAFKKHVDVEVPVLCDPISVTLRVSLGAKTLSGGDWSTQQSLSHVVHQDLEAFQKGLASPAQKGQTVG